MSLPRELLEQARHLATRERKRPRQASLRRAISAAYYALFHLLVRDATQRALRGNRDSWLRPLLARGFEHNVIGEFCKSVAGGNWPKPFAEMISPTRVSRGTATTRSSGAHAIASSIPPPPDLRLVAEAVRDLQEARNNADYDPQLCYARIEVLEFVEKAEDAFAAWKRVRLDRLATLFLLGLLLGRRVHGRGA